MAQSFGAQMRQRREERQIALATIVEKTKIKQSLLEAMERDDLSQWPNGFIRRAFIKAYAQAIGLSPDDVVRDFLDFHGENTADAPPLSSLTAIHESRLGGPPTRLRQMVGSAVTRFRSSTHPSATANDHGGSAAATRPRRTTADNESVPVGDLLAMAKLCANLARTRRTNDMSPLFQEAARILDASGLIIWTWEPRIERLRASWAHGYSDTVLAQLPLVPIEAENAVAAAFRSSRTSFVTGADSGCHAVVVPLVTAERSVGALAIEWHQADEVPGRIEALATIVAAQLARIVEEPPEQIVTASTTEAPSPSGRTDHAVLSERQVESSPQAELARGRVGNDSRDAVIAQPRRPAEDERVS